MAKVMGRQQHARPISVIICLYFALLFHSFWCCFFSLISKPNFTLIYIKIFLFPRSSFFLRNGREIWTFDFIFDSEYFMLQYHHQNLYTSLCMIFSWLKTQFFFWLKYYLNSYDLLFRFYFIFVHVFSNFNFILCTFDKV